MSHNCFIISRPILVDYEKVMTHRAVLRSILALRRHAYFMSHSLFISLLPWSLNYEQVMTHVSLSPVRLLLPTTNYARIVRRNCFIISLQRP